MIISTTDTVDGKKVTQHLGLVTGNTVRARHVGKDILASLRNIVGGEVHEYTKLMAEAREQALDRLKDQASEMGANAVIGVRFSTAMVMQNVAEILVYGTAVVVK